MVDLDKFQSISHLITTHAAGCGGRAGDREVVWGGGWIRPTRGMGSAGGL
jgi:hypothetical protein